MLRLADRPDAQRAVDVGQLGLVLELGGIKRIVTCPQLVERAAIRLDVGPPTGEVVVGDDG
jgi:hypothetical protein